MRATRNSRLQLRMPLDFLYVARGVIGLRPEKGDAVKKGKKLVIEELEKPHFMTDGEWQASLEAISMLNETIPDEVWGDIEGKIGSLDRIRSDGREDKEKFLATGGRESTTS